MQKVDLEEAGFSLGTDSKEVEAFIDGELRILKSMENTKKWGWLKHISVSCDDRYPSWEELRTLKIYFFGDIDCMMMMPKKSDYVNVHRNCFHIWECPESWDIQ